MSKRGQYFTIDAFIALVVISTGLILVIAATSYSPSPRQPEDLAEELVSSFVDQKINEINNEFLKDKTKEGYNDPTSPSGITNPRNTILQQAYEFYFIKCNPPPPSPPPATPSTGCGEDPDFPGNSVYEEFLKAVADDLIPEQYGFQLLIDNDVNERVIYERLPALDLDPFLSVSDIPLAVAKSQEETELLVSGKRLIFGKNDQTKEFWGPYDAEVRVWQ